MVIAAIFKFLIAVAGIPKQETDQCSETNDSDILIFLFFLKKGSISVMTNSHTMFICSALLNHTHTKGNYTLFSKKASVAADIGTLAQSAGRAI